MCFFYVEFYVMFLLCTQTDFLISLFLFFPSFFPPLSFFFFFFIQSRNTCRVNSQQIWYSLPDQMPFSLSMLLHGSKGHKGKGSLTNPCTSTRYYGVLHFFEVLVLVLLKRAQRRPHIHTHPPPIQVEWHVAELWETRCQPQAQGHVDFSLE